MTDVKVKRSGKRCCLEAKGHATGSVAVCAGISAVLYALVGYLANHEGQVIRQHIADADVCIEFEGDAESIAAFEMAVIGLMQIELMHPEYISVKNPNKCSNHRRKQKADMIRFDCPK
jgi:uncharacterized protein YsxB (DUF464 family)